jgi:signal recognition particle subunit SEC65
MLHLKLLQKQEQAYPKTSWREIIKIMAEINETETKKQPHTKNQ